MNSKLHDLIRERQVAQQQADDAKTRVTELNTQILTELEESGRDRYEDVDGSATIVRPNKKRTYDWAKLKKLIGVLNWKRIILEVPSEELLERAVAEGRISTEVLGQCIIEQPAGKPYVRVSKPR